MKDESENIKIRFNNLSLRGGFADVAISVEEKEYHRWAGIKDWMYTDFFGPPARYTYSYSWI